MKTTMKFLAAGLLASALTFVGCSSNKSADRTDRVTDPMTTTGDDRTGTETDNGTGGAGDTNTTMPPDDSLRTPESEPLRTPESESIRDAESEPGVHDNSAVDPGTGGAGFGDDDATIDETLNPPGEADETLRIPDSPADTVPDTMSGNSEIPEGAR
jgi:hypothetical protein